MRVQGLDALRGVAIALVILRHATGNALGGAGIVGVTLFFALSGYLISGLLMNEVASTGRVDFRRFYTHRAFRLVPALLAVLVAFVVVDGVLNLTGQRSHVAQTVAVALTYTADLPGFGVEASTMGHLWTLAIEEQFYVIWPAVLLFGVRHNRLGTFIAGSGAVMYVVLVASVVLVAPDFWRLYMLPSTWGIAMVIGAAARVWRVRVLAWVGPTRLGAGALVSAALLAGVAITPDLKQRPELYLGAAAIIGAAAIVPILWAERVVVTPRWIMPLVGLGTISYAAYLWNYPLTLWFEEALPVAGRPLAAPATLIVATASWFLLERPMRTLRRRVDARRASPSVAADAIVA